MAASQSAAAPGQKLVVFVKVCVQCKYPKLGPPAPTPSCTGNPQPPPLSHLSAHHSCKERIFILLICLAATDIPLCGSALGAAWPLADHSAATAASRGALAATCRALQNG